MKPRPLQPNKDHKVVITGNKPSLVTEIERSTKEAADYEYNRGVSMVNRKMATKVEWYLPGGKLHKKVENKE